MSLRSPDEAFLAEAAARLETRVPGLREAPPEIALVLGSGLGELVEAAADWQAVPTADLPGYPVSTVAGHAGRLLFGRWQGRSAAVVQGRVHFYEGLSLAEVLRPVRLLRRLGARRLILTNAAGGINPRFTPGTLMLIDDHLNLALGGPLPLAPPPHRGANPYDAAWLAEAREIARAQGAPVEVGVYAWTRGPSYETPAEIRMFRALGADAVGMSTVPEALLAHRLGMRVLALSTVTNAAAGLSAAPLDHAEVLEVGRSVRERLGRLLAEIVRRAG